MNKRNKKVRNHSHFQYGLCSRTLAVYLMYCGGPFQFHGNADREIGHERFGADGQPNDPPSMYGVGEVCEIVAL